MYENERKELEQICHLLYHRNLVTASDGNVSMRGAEGHILLTPSGKNKGLVNAGEMMVLNLEGSTVEGKGSPSKEYPMHRIIYQNRPDVGAVVHSHPVYATAFALAGKNLPDDYLIEMRMMLGGTALAGYATPGTMEMAMAVEPFLADYQVILLKNHGVVTFGGNLIEAFNRMEVVESIAKTIIMSNILGQPQLISEADLLRMKGV